MPHRPCQERTLQIKHPTAAKIPLILELLIAVMTENGRARMPPAPKQPVKETKATDFRSACYLLFSRKHFCFAALWLLFAEIHQTPDLQNRQHGDTCDPYATRSRWPHHFSSVPNCPPRIVSTARTRRSSITGKVRIGQSTSRNFARTSSL